MQLGTRWAAGSEAPTSVPDSLRPAIAELESAIDASGARWTLTWLEGRPIAELDAGWEIVLTADGTVITRPFAD